MTDFQRLEKLIKILDIPTFKDLAVKLNVSPQTFYDIKQGKHGISKKLAEQINKCFPEIPVSWLLTGEGDLIIGDGNINGNNNNSSDAVLKAIEAISEQQKITMKSQEQIDRLLNIIDKLS